MQSDPNENKKTVTDFYDFISSLGTKSVETFVDSFKPGMKEILNTVQQVDSEAVKVAKSFGQGRENILSIKTTLVDAANSVEALGGKFENVAEIQNSLNESIKRNVLLSSDSYAKLFAAQEVTGVKTGEMFTNFKNIGTSAYGVADGMQKIVNTAREQGLSVEAVSKQAMSNMEAMNKYTFQGGVDGLSKMAAQATSLRIDMKTALDFADGLYKPEKAIEMSAALQRLGVTQSELLDPLRLMDLSINDPAELQNQLVEMTQQFVTMGEAGNFEIAPEGKLRLRELGEAMNIPYDQLTKMALGSAELEDKLSKIRFPSFMNEDQQKMIANLAEMKDGEYVITIDGKAQNLEDLLARTDSPEELEKILEAAKPKTMEELAEEQLSLQESMEASLRKISGRTSRALATTDIIEELGNATREGFKGMTDIITDNDVLSAKSIRELVNVNSDIIGDFGEKMMRGEEVDLSSVISEMGEESGGIFNQQLEGLGANFNEQIQKLGESDSGIAKVITQGFNALADYIFEETGVNIMGTIPMTPTTSEQGQAVSGKQTQNTTQNINNNSTVDVTIRVEVPPGLSEKEVEEALGTTKIQEQVIEFVKKGLPDYKTKPE